MTCLLTWQRRISPHSTKAAAAGAECRPSQKHQFYVADVRSTHHALTAVLAPSDNLSHLTHIYFVFLLMFSKKLAPGGSLPSKNECEDVCSKFSPIALPWVPCLALPVWPKQQQWGGSRRAGCRTDWAENSSQQAGLLHTGHTAFSVFTFKRSFYGVDNMWTGQNPLWYNSYNNFPQSGMAQWIYGILSGAIFILPLFLIYPYAVTHSDLRNDLSSWKSDPIQYSYNKK